MRAAALLIPLMLNPAAALAALDQAMFMLLSPSLVKVEAYNRDGSVSLGSGVVVAPGKVVTNCHVTRRADRLQLVRNGARWPVEGQMADTAHDLCVLIAPEVQSRVARIGEPSALRQGQKVIAAGFPGGVGARYSEGRVVALHDFDGGLVIQSSAQFDLGASGGGLFDGDGKLVGIITFKNRDRRGDAYHFSMPVDWVVSEIIGGDHPPQPVGPLGEARTFWELPVAEQPLFLRAASLEARSAWQEMLALAEAWVAEEGHHAQPWVALGKARMQLGQPDAAVDALRHAVELDRHHAEAWFQLGLAQAARHDCPGLDEAMRVLARLDAGLARDLGRQTTQIVQHTVSKESSCV